jgi:hypothetical protein
MTTAGVGTFAGDRAAPQICGFGHSRSAGGLPGGSDALEGAAHWEP